MSFLPDPLIVRSSLLSRFFYSRVVWHKYSSRLLWAETSRQPCWSNSTTTLARMCHMRAPLAQICLVIAGGDAAYMNQVDADGQTALFLSCSTRYYGAISALLEAGADPNITDRYGCAPLHEAVRWRANNVMLMLLNAKASVSVTDIDHETPLMFAAAQGFSTGVRILLRHGADVTMTNCYGENVSDMVRDDGRNTMLELLESYKL